jgi:CDP-diacylglycerol--glycerol-3-phosphate 3-phosphatidyltransferase
MIKLIPNILLFSRPIFIGAIVFLAVTRPPHANLIVLSLITVCLVTDILDGIIARRLNISTTQFRVLDTIFDLAFYLCTLGYVFSINPVVLETNARLILSILTLEVLLYLTSLIRFGRLPSPHAFLSKVWGLYLAVEFYLLILQVEGNHFQLALCFGVIVHIDRLLIYLFLKSWDHDIPSSYHAWLLRNGKSITRHQLLNG